MIPVLNNINPVQSHYLDFLNALKVTAFSGDISPDYASRTVLSTDNSIYQVLPQGVIYPANENDLIILAQLADQEKYRDIVLSARGGGTGTNGQSLTDGIVVDVSKHMNTVIEINPEEKWVRVQAGVVKDQLNAALKPHGLFFAPELSTSNRATIGGMINTDASGQGSCLYGKTRDHVLELKTVLLDGSVISSRAINETELEAICEQQDKSGLIHRIVNNIQHEHKDLINETFPPLNRCLTGYDLAHIRDENNHFNLNSVICGSEGTLGFISEAKLNILSIPKHSALVIVKYDNFDTSLRDATELMKAQPTSIETIDSKVLKLAMNDFIWHQVGEFFDDENSDQVQGMNLVEYTASSEEQLKSNLSGLTQALDQDHANTPNKRLGYAVAWGDEAVKRIWGMRKRAVGLLGNAESNARPIPFVEDTAVPPEHLADFILEFREILDAYNLDYGMFGHVDAGVLHVRPALDMKDPEQEKIAWEISDRIAELTQQYHGLLWGEHGKGVRSEYAPKFFGELYPQLQRVKSAFDPHNQLNPGKIATPTKDIDLIAIDEFPTRGQRDREIPVKVWDAFDDAVYCNGNGACYNWNPNDAMCPSWKATRERSQSPKGRASLLREWLTLVSQKSDTAIVQSTPGILNSVVSLPQKIRSWREKSRGNYDFSHQVYDAMATCLACKSCAGQCPIKVNVPEFRSQFLAQYHSRYFRPLKDYLVGSLETLLPVCSKAPRLYNTLMGLTPIKSILANWVGFVDGPKLSLENLRSLEFASETTLAALSVADRENCVVIVQDAFTSYFEAQLLLDICELLKKLGLRPLIAPYKANGKPLHVHGFLKQFEKVASRNAKHLNHIAAYELPLVGIDPSMTLTYQSEYAKTLENDNAPKVQLIQDWLVENIESLTIPNTQSEQTKRFRLLPHCTESTNASGSIKNWQRLFKAFGSTLLVESVGCCGMSGTFGHEARNVETSKKIFTMSWQQKVEQFHDKEELVATGFSCRSQVKREAQKSIPHPLQALLKTIEEL
ncbi:MAG: FAD-binding oxidoreductase [Agarilytica sp.]